jgi:FKBP-type peptidyl-prolyl cis-trans isomerase
MKKALLLLLMAMVLGVPACGSEDESTTGAGAEAEAEDEDQECLVTEDIAVGDGAEATSGSIVTVEYTGTLEDGTEFDSSRQPGREPFTFPLGGGQVIQGWDEGVVGMREGGTRKLTICSDMAYGETGFPPTIPENATLLFEVELIKVKKA